MSTSAKGKLSTAEEVLQKFQRKTREDSSEKTSDAVQVKKYEKIEENPFYKIMFSEGSPEAKKAAYEKALEYDETKSKAENSAMREANEQFKDWLNEYSKQVAKELIRISDTKAFAELQSVLDEMNSSLLNFEQMIGPLIDTIKAIHTLNIESGGKMYDVFKEIKEDEAAEAEIEQQKAMLQEDADRLEQDIQRLNGDKAAALADKPWYLFGKTRGSSVQEAARLEAEIDQKRGEVVDINTEYNSLKLDRESQFADLAEEKAKLREFLNLSSAENEERQKNLVQAALNFVEKMDTKSGSVLSQMEGLRDHIEQVSDTNGKMGRAFTVIQEAETSAAESSSELAKKFATAGENESSLEKMERETTLENVNEHVTVLADAANSTLKTSINLGEEAIAIQNIKDNNRRQIKTAKEMNTSGTASIANRLVSTLTSFSSAALNEGKTTLANTMGTMDAMTRDIMREDVIQAAAGAHIENDELAKMIEELAKTGDVSEQGIEIQRAAIDTQNKLRESAQDQIARLKELVKETKGIAAEAVEAAKGYKPEPAEERVEKPKFEGPGAGGLNI